MAAVVLATLVAALHLSCSGQGGTQRQFTAGGRTYHYRVLEQQIKDLDTDVLNVTQIATEHCDLTISNELDSSQSKVVQWAEDGYERTSKDFGFEMTRYRPIIYYLNHYQYQSFVKGNSGGIMVGPSLRYPNHIFIDAGRFSPDSAASSVVFTHELCHLILWLVSGEIDPRTDEKLSTHLKSLYIFCEAIAEEEELTRDPLSLDLQKSFPDGKYIALDQMDTVTANVLSFGGIEECRALVQLVKSSGRPDALTNICALLGKMTVEEAIEKETGWTSAELQQKWFAYMDDLRSQQD